MAIIYEIGSFIIALEYAIGATIFLVDVIKAIIKRDKSEPIGLDLFFFVIFSAGCAVFAGLGKVLFEERVRK